jgi:mono/diheme cytochrome c family protein
VSKRYRYLAVILAASGWSAAIVQGRSDIVWQPEAAKAVFTKAQVEAGRPAYQAYCASCHTPDLGGRNEFPALAGDDFFASWRGRTTQELYDFISATMPPEGPSLTPEQYLGITALILQENGASAGAEALTPTTAVPIGSIATGKRPGVAHALMQPPQSSR